VNWDDLKREMSTSEGPDKWRAEDPLAGASSDELVSRLQAHATIESRNLKKAKFLVGLAAVIFGLLLILQIIFPLSSGYRT